MTERLIADDPLVGSPPGTCVEQTPGVFLVMGDRGVSYGVRPDEGLCECPHFVHACGPKGGPSHGHFCKHLRWCYDHLMQSGERMCPVCAGVGSWENGDDPSIDCRACNGEGQVDVGVYPIILHEHLSGFSHWMHPEHTATVLSEDDMRKVFA